MTTILDTLKIADADLRVMRFAYRQLLQEYPVRYATIEQKEELAKSVSRIMYNLKNRELVTLIMSVDA